MLGMSDERQGGFAGFKKIVLWVGIACLLQFLVFGAIGVARGYSIQSWIPAWVMIGGIILLIPFSRKHVVASFLSSFTLIVFSLVSISQGDHQREADKLYDTGAYAEAMTEYRKELDTWYLHLSYNHREGPSLDGIAKCQSQLEKFTEARETYDTMVSRLRGFHKKRAEEAIADLDTHLNEVAELGKELAVAEADQAKALLLFDLALVYRQLNCTAKAVEQYEAIQALEIDERFKKQARSFAEDLS